MACLPKAGRKSELTLGVTGEGEFHLRTGLGTGLNILLHSGSTGGGGSQKVDSGGVIDVVVNSIRDKLLKCGVKRRSDDSWVSGSTGKD